MFMLFSCIPSIPPYRRAAQPVVDCLAQSVMGNRHYCDAARPCGIKRAKIAEKIGGGFVEIATRRQIHDGTRRLHILYGARPERQQRLSRLKAFGVKPHPGSGRVMGRQHARSKWLTVFAVIVLRGVRQRAAKHALDIGGWYAAGAQQHRTLETADDGGLDAHLDRPTIDDEIDPPGKIALHMSRSSR